MRGCTLQPTKYGLVSQQFIALCAGELCRMEEQRVQLRELQLRHVVGTMEAIAQQATRADADVTKGKAKEKAAEGELEVLRSKTAVIERENKTLEAEIDNFRSEINAVNARTR